MGCVGVCMWLEFMVIVMLCVNLFVLCALSCLPCSMVGALPVYFDTFFLPLGFLSFSFLAGRILFPQRTKRVSGIFVTSAKLFVSA